MLEKALGGYNRKILRVNLSNQRISEEATDELFCRRYLGGAGFVAYYLWKELPAGIDTLGPDNKLVFALGPVTGVSLGGSGRHCVGAKSPLTHLLVASPSRRRENSGERNSSALVMMR
jgi:aldehyde:ferredoxin oxidoreductase